MINKSTNESQSTAQISANTQPNSKATKLLNKKEQREEKPIKSLLQCEINFSNLNHVSTIRPIKMKNNVFRTCCKIFSTIQRWMNPQCQVYS